MCPTVFMNCSTFGGHPCYRRARGAHIGPIGGMVKSCGEASPGGVSQSPRDGAGRKPLLGAIKVVRLVPPVRTGNAEIDQNALTAHTCRESCIDDLLNIPELAQPVFNLIRDEKKAIEARKAVSDGGVDLFKGQTSVSALDEEYKVRFVTRHSDLNGSDVVLMMKYAAEQLNDLIAYALGLPMKGKLPMQFLVKEVLSKFWDDRVELLGNRLREFKKTGGLGKDGRCSFGGDNGAYSLTFNKDGFLEEIKHRSGDVAAVAQGTGLSENHTLRDNHDDYQACLVMPPMPDVRLASFFSAKDKSGPHQYTCFHGRPKELQRVAEEYHEQWSSERRANASKLSVSDEVKHKLEEHSRQEKSEKMNKARKAAEAAMAKKKLAAPSA